MSSWRRPPRLVLWFMKKRQCSMWRVLAIHVVLVLVTLLLLYLSYRSSSIKPSESTKVQVHDSMQSVVGEPAVEPPETEKAADLSQNEEHGEPAEIPPKGLGPLTVPPSQNSSGLTEEACRPKSRIVFLKTHKTGSSTLINIMFRYGDSRNLTFALPRHRSNLFSYPQPFRSNMVEGFSSRSRPDFHIICNHMTFNKSEVAKVMPEDSFYFSILRHPVAMMESMFVYFHGFPGFPRDTSLGDILDHNLMTKNPESHNAFTHNILAFDLGQDNRVTADSGDLEERAAQAIASIQRDFHLLLINEYFDESMILLRHALCWSLDDVVSFKLNSRSNKSRIPVSPETAEKTKRWNALDWRIYLHFNATFWEKVRSLGEELVRREVSELRKLRAQLTETCLRGGQAVDPGQIKDAGLKPFQGGAAVVLGYNLNQDLDAHTAAKCRNLVLQELPYTRLLFDRQFQKRGGAK